MILFKNKKVFVSGGNGVIGNELVNQLYKEGATILVGDLKPRPIDWPKGIIYRQGDLNYISRGELEEFGPEYFFHLAATFERSAETYDFWGENYRHNIKLSNYLMTLLKDSKTLKRVIFASSYLIYSSDLYTSRSPLTKPFRLKENALIYPRNLTGMAKLSHEMELKFLNDFKRDNYSVVSARIFRSYGKKSRDIISRWVRALLKEETISVYAKEGMFDYIYAGDVAEGLIRLAKSTKIEGIVNLGRGKARRVEEVLGVLKRHFPSMRVKEIGTKIDYEASEADMEYFVRVTGWKPEKQIEDIIPELIAFEKRGQKNTIEKKAGNLLITSISHKIPLFKSVRQAVKKIGKDIKIYGGDIATDAVGRYFADKYWKMPPIYSLDIKKFISYCNNNDIKYVIPTRDGELFYFAKNKVFLKKNGIEVMVSAEKAVKICLDKLHFYKKLRGIKIPAIATSDRLEDINGKKFVVKERFGAGSKKIGLNLTRKEAIDHSLKLDNPIFQPYIKGREVSVDLYVTRDGKTKGVVSRTRDLVINGESRVTSSISHKLLEGICAKTAEALKLYGHVIFQAIIDAKGRIHVVECNCRFGGASSLSVACGLDVFYWFLLEAAGADISDYLFIKSKSNKRQIRYFDDIITNDISI